MVVGEEERKLSLEEACRRLKANDADLKSLDLSDSKIGDAGAVAISFAIKQNNFCTELILRNAGIGPSGAAKLASALKVNYTVERLYLQANEIGDKGAEAIAKAFQENASLRVLNLSKCMVGDIGAAALAQELVKNEALFKLYLYDNLIGNVGASALAELVLENKTLQELFVWDNKIGEAGMDDLAAAYDMTSGNNRRIQLRTTWKTNQPPPKRKDAPKKAKVTEKKLTDLIQERANVLNEETKEESVEAEKEDDKKVPDVAKEVASTPTVKARAALVATKNFDGKQPKTEEPCLPQAKLAALAKPKVFDLRMKNSLNSKAAMHEARKESTKPKRIDPGLLNALNAKSSGKGNHKPAETRKAVRQKSFETKDPVSGDSSKGRIDQNLLEILKRRAMSSESEAGENGGQRDDTKYPVSVSDSSATVVQKERKIEEKSETVAAVNPGQDDASALMGGDRQSFDAEQGKPGDGNKGQSDSLMDQRLAPAKGTKSDVSETKSVEGPHRVVALKRVKGDAKQESLGKDRIDQGLLAMLNRRAQSIENDDKGVLRHTVEEKSGRAVDATTTKAKGRPLTVQANQCPPQQPQVSRKPEAKSMKDQKEETQPVVNGRMDKDLLQMLRRRAKSIDDDKDGSTETERQAIDRQVEKRSEPTRKAEMDEKVVCDDASLGATGMTAPEKAAINVSAGNLSKQKEHIDPGLRALLDRRAKAIEKTLTDTKLTLDSAEDVRNGDPSVSKETKSLEGSSERGSEAIVQPVSDEEKSGPCGVSSVRARALAMQRDLASIQQKRVGA